MAQFNLGERELNLNIKNFTLPNPSDTLFQVTDHNGESYYKGNYNISDITKLPDEGLILDFGTQHCKYNIVFDIDPNNYQKDVNIEYKYNNSFDCKVDIFPEEIEQNMTIQTTSQTPNFDISLNDLQVWHYMSGFIFGLFLIITIGIYIIDKKGLLIHNKRK